MQHRAFVTGEKMRRADERPHDVPRPTRRDFLTTAAAAAVTLGMPAEAMAAATVPEAGLIVRDGWVLRADDLPRLARA